jgi:adenine phosphoribosyltransferase
MGLDRIEKTTLQLRAVAVLRTRKRTRTFEELAAETGLSAGDLNRYVNGHVLPGVDRARRIVEEAGRETVTAELDARISRDEEGYVDTSEVVFDRRFLELAAPVVAESFAFDRPDVVLTAATDGITLATAVASHYDARVAYAKKRKETAVEEFYESRERLASGIELTYYLPRNALSAGESVLIVDDLVRSGETQSLLLDVTDQAEASVTGVFALIAVGDEGLSRVRGLADAPVAALRTYE